MTPEWIRFDWTHLGYLERTGFEIRIEQKEFAFKMLVEFQGFGYCTVVRAEFNSESDTRHGLQMRTGHDKI